MKPSFSNDPFYQSHEWKSFRDAFMSLPENYYCWVCRDSGVTRKATVCDHIVNKRFIDDPFDVTNLQPLCSTCHNKKSYGERNLIPTNEREVIFLVGACCSGKSTYIAKHKQPCDLIIDMDGIHASLSLKPLHERDNALVHVSMKVKDFLLEQALLPNQFKRVWITSVEPDHNKLVLLASRFADHGCKVGVLKMKADKGECLRRLYDSDRTDKPKYEALIKSFFRHEKSKQGAGQISGG